MQIKHVLFIKLSLKSFAGLQGKIKNILFIQLRLRSCVGLKDIDANWKYLIKIWDYMQVQKTFMQIKYVLFIKLGV